MTELTANARNTLHVAQDLPWEQKELVAGILRAEARQARLHEEHGRDLELVSIAVLTPLDAA